jgi:hypothetical protein
MSTTISAERSKLQQQYSEPRARILSILELVGQQPDSWRGRAKITHVLPLKLGHWQPRHSQLVRGLGIKELDVLVARIEALLACRDPKLITSQHVKGKRGKRKRREFKPFELICETPRRYS